MKLCFFLFVGILIVSAVCFGDNNFRLMERPVVKEIEGLTFCAQHVGDLGAYCTLVYDKESDSLAIVDPGGDVPDLLNALRKLRGKRSGPLAHAMIILTHARLLPTSISLSVFSANCLFVFFEQISIMQKVFRT